MHFFFFFFSFSLFVFCLFVCLFVLFVTSETRHLFVFFFSFRHSLCSFIFLCYIWLSPVVMFSCYTWHPSVVFSCYIWHSSFIMLSLYVWHSSFIVFSLHLALVIHRVLFTSGTRHSSCSLYIWHSSFIVFSCYSSHSSFILFSCYISHSSFIMFSCYISHSSFIMFACYVGIGDSSVMERRPRNRNVAGSSPGRSGGRIFFSRVNFLCWLLFVTAGARKQSGHSRWQVTDKQVHPT